MLRYCTGLAALVESPDTAAARDIVVAGTENTVAQGTVAVDTVAAGIADTAALDIVEFDSAEPGIAMLPCIDSHCY